MMMNYALQLNEIDKSFSSIQVIKKVSLSIRKNEIHALLGENGAGKSTLMNILGGVLLPDEGEIIIDGVRHDIDDPKIAKSLGISFIHQELNVISDLRVYENMFLGSELTNRLGILQVQEMCLRCTEVLNKMGIALDPKAYVRDLEPSYKQIIEIAKALLERTKIIIMDEPTTSLSEHEIKKLIELMKSLKNSGVSIIYISHKLKEIMAVCDRYTVLRDGYLAGSGEIKDVNEEILTSLMVGKSVATFEYRLPVSRGAEILRVEQLSDNKFFHNVSFDLKEGEVLGFTGLAGDGRTELFESVFGYRKSISGKVYVAGQQHRINHPSKALAAGIALVPKNRKENAIIKDMTVLQNMTLTSLDRFRKYGLIDQKRERKRFFEYKEQLNIKVSNPNISIVNLSGGNQQKVVLAKWMEVDSSIIILDNPTQGIDVGAKAEIYEIIMRLRQEGKSLILLSTEIPEILKVCDRVVVMAQGEITANLHRDEANEENIMLYATGAKRKEFVV